MIGPGNKFPLKHAREFIMRALHRMMQEGGNVIVIIDNEKNYYVQFSSEIKDDGLYGEAVSNNWLSGENKLDETQIAKLEAMGWMPPDHDSGNFWRTWENVRDIRDLSPVADDVIRTFTDVYGANPYQETIIEVIEG